MNISDVLSEKMILVDVSANNKRDLLSKLSAFAAEQEDLDKDEIFEVILERENLGSTGYGNGVAFPHARVEGLHGIVMVIARLEQGIDFDALDAQPVDIVAFMVSPENSGDDHLQVLAGLSRALKNEDVCKKIRQARSTHDIYVALQ